jgi:hypothetical protein
MGSDVGVAGTGVGDGIAIVVGVALTRAEAGVLAFGAGGSTSTVEEVAAQPDKLMKNNIIIPATIHLFLNKVPSSITVS